MVKSWRSQLFARITAGFFATLIVCSTTAHAAVKLPTGRESQWKENSILFYNPEGCETITSPAMSVPEGGTAEEMIWGALKSIGLTDFQAAAALANILAESGFNPVIANSIGATGLVQWLGGRKTGLLNYIRSRDPSLMQYFNSSYYSGGGDGFIAKAGKDVAAKLIMLEIQYLSTELHSSYYSGFLSTTSLDEATRYFLSRVEAPGGDYGKSGPHSARYTNAEMFYNRYGGSDGYMVDSTSSDVCLTRDENGNIIYNPEDGTFIIIDDAGEILEGGLTYAQAVIYAQRYGLNANGFVEATVGGLWCVNEHDNCAGANCVTFSAFFINAFTSGYRAGATWGNGDRFIYGLGGGTISNTPQVGSVFSMRTYDGRLTHTGVILGIHNGQYIIGESDYSLSSTGPGNGTYGSGSAYISVKTGDPSSWWSGTQYIQFFIPNSVDMNALENFIN